jgi:hypothetical protein
MYWGLQIHGGYFIHSSPHYGNLGKPASMGCVRASFPDAMELFELVANVHAGRPSYIIIFEDVALEVPGEGARVLRQVLSESSWSIERLKSALARSRAEVEAVSKGDLEFAPGVPADAVLPLIHGRAHVTLHLPEAAVADVRVEATWRLEGEWIVARAESHR